MKGILALIVLLTSLSAVSQDDYKLITEEDGVKVYAKWGREKWLKKDSPKVLLTWVENTTDKDVIYKIGMEFFYQTTLSETFPTQEFCVKSGKSKKGKLDGVYYKSCDLSNEQIMSDDFDYSVVFEIVDDDADCSEFSKE